MLANCYFTAGVIGSGSGFKCDTLFDNDALGTAYTIDSANTKVIPTTKKLYYPDETVYLHFAYNSQADDFNDPQFDLAYKVECPASSGTGKAYRLGYKTIQPDPARSYNRLIIDLFPVPSVVSGESSVNAGSYSTYSTKISKEVYDINSKNILLVFENKDEVNSKSFELVDIGERDYSLGCDYGKNTLAPKEVLKCPISISSSSDSVEIKMGLRGATNIDFKIQNKDGNNLNSFNSYLSETDFDSLKVGTCTATVKLLKAGQGAEAAMSSIAIFDNYSGVSSDIIVSKNVKTQNTFTFKFNIGKVPDQNSNQIKDTTYFELISPFSQSSFCIDDSNLDLNLLYLFTTKENSAEYKLEYSWALVNYGYNGPKIEITPEKNSLFRDDKANQKFSISSEAFNTIKDKGSQQVTLVYSLKRNGEVLSSKSGSVTFNIEAKEKCEENSFYGYKWKLISDGVSPGSSGSSGNGNTQVN